MINFSRLVDLRPGKLFFLTAEMVAQLQESKNYGLFSEALPMVLVLNTLKKSYPQTLVILPKEKKDRGIHLFLPKCKAYTTLIIIWQEGNNAAAITTSSYFELVANKKIKALPIPR